MFEDLNNICFFPIKSTVSFEDQNNKIYFKLQQNFNLLVFWGLKLLVEILKLTSTRKELLQNYIH